MKNILAVLFILISVQIFGDDFQVIEDVLENSMSVKLIRMENKDKIDINGDICGLLIVRSGIKKMMIQSPFKYKQQYKGGEYFIFLSPGTKRVTFKKEGFGNFKYDFRDKIGGIKSNMVYEMAITNRGGGISADENFVTLTFDINETNVYIGKENSVPVLAKSKLTNYNLPAGKYKFFFSKDGFETTEKLIELSADKTEQIILQKGESSQEMLITGFADIKTEPKGVEILINGQKIGTSPFTIDELFPGEYEITLRKNYYHSQTMTFSLAEGATFAPKKIVLKPKFGYISINSFPENADVIIDNIPHGNTPINRQQIESGRHTVRVKYSLFHDYAEEFIISDGEDKKINAELDKAFGELVINSTPESGANVFIGNNPTPVGKTPFINKQMVSGKYNIRISKDLWSDTEDVIIVKDDQKTERTLLLTKNFGTIKITANDSQIFLDTKNVGNNKFEKKLKPGKYLFRATRPKHHSAEKEVVIRVGQNEIIELSPKPMEGVVSVKCQAEDKPGSDVNAQLFINGKKHKTNSPASMKLLIGKYDLVAKHNNFLDYKEQFQIEEGDRLKLTLNMKTYEGSILAKANKWRFQKYTALSLSLITAGAATYFHLQSETNYDDYCQSSTSPNAKNLWDDYNKNGDYRNYCIYAGSSTAVYWVFSWIKQNLYLKKIKN